MRSPTNQEDDMLQGMATVNFYAADLDEAARWYTGVLGMAPYYVRPGYVEFRVGRHEDELGIIDARYAPAGRPETPGGAILHWVVADPQATLARLVVLGATEYQPVTTRGEGFVTASVVDPFGNVLGFMTNPHWSERV
jgi:catechol 2,3-dioxygenase-like lactoylglutathione lyase family enzyme